MRRLLQASCQLSLHRWLAYMLHKLATSWFSWFSTTLHSTRLPTRSFTRSSTLHSTRLPTLHSTRLSTLHSTRSSTLHSTRLSTRSSTFLSTRHSTCSATYSIIFASSFIRLTLESSKFSSSFSLHSFYFLEQ